MSGPAKNGLVVSGQAVGTVQLDVSADQGQTWNSAGDLLGKFEKDLTEQVKGRYGWWLRFRFTKKAGLDALRFTTVTQLAQPIYPRLKPEGCPVVYRAGSRAVVPVLPHFATPDSSPSGSFEEKPLRSANVIYQGREKWRLAYLVQGPRPGYVVFRVAAPERLLQVSAAARFNVRVPPPAGCDYRMDVSTDGGKTWKPLAQADIPKDNEFSSGWMYGSADVSAAKAQTALVRVHLFAGGHQAGLMTAEVYGTHATPAPGPVKLTYAWKEGGALKTHVETIPPGSADWKFTVPTGKQIVDEYVRLEAP